MTFVDECTVFVEAGRGGNGSAHLHSEPYKPQGGPDGGDGGAGGSVVFEVQPGLHDLGWLGEHPHQRAGHGGAGRSANRDGATGKDLVIPVPDGTVVYDEQGLVADLVGEGARAVVARGGRGGRGNVAFAGPRNRVPRTAEQGEEGEEKTPARGAAHGGRRRVDRPAERRQVHPAVATDGGEAEDRELPVHDPHAEPGRGRRGRRTVRGGGHPGARGGREPGARPGPSVPAPCRAMPRAGPGDRSVAGERGRGTGGRPGRRDG